MQFFLLIGIITMLSCSSNSPLEADEEKKEEGPKVLVPLADPFILLHNNTYYAYGTGADDGIAVLTSDDLKVWEKPKGVGSGLALHKYFSYGDKWFWAPEVYYVNGKFYMYYSAEEHICVAVSDSPLGPFKQTIQKPMLESEKAIDN
ncbi:MAG: family 43 glycosylhydrolase, partial [Dysgonamonadaceae bacterium]|nr:family 43 glycosylhydrolase [Dysgonamonadaceae bacterium]